DVCSSDLLAEAGPAADGFLVMVAIKARPFVRVKAAGAGRAAATSVQVALEQAVVGVDAAVAQERPDPPDLLAALHVQFGQQQRRLAAGLGQELALRPQDVAVAPEVDARRAQRRGLVAD